jgi:hypothetical protein
MSYAKLRGRIKEVFGSQDAFAKEIGLDSSSVSAKLNNKTEWTRKQIIDAATALNLSVEDIPDYFFCRDS